MVAIQSYSGISVTLEHRDLPKREAMFCSSKACLPRVRTLSWVTQKIHKAGSRHLWLDPTRRRARWIQKTVTQFPEFRRVSLLPPDIIALTCNQPAQLKARQFSPMSRYSGVSQTQSQIPTPSPLSGFVTLCKSQPSLSLFPYLYETRTYISQGSCDDE